MTSTPDQGGDQPPVISDVDTTEETDERLLESHDLARTALEEITPAATIGDPIGHSVEGDGVISLRFETRLLGYPGWFWTVSVARVEDAEPTVLEVELLPGDHALLAPEWVPWAVRLADYQAAHAAQRESDSDDSDTEADDEDLEDELDDVDDLDAADFDEDGSPHLHSGDVDGVDIDELAEDLEDDGDPERDDVEGDEVEGDDLEGDEVEGDEVEVDEVDADEVVDATSAGRDAEEDVATDGIDAGRV